MFLGASFCEDRALLGGIISHLLVLHFHASSFSLHPLTLSPTELGFSETL